LIPYFIITVLLIILILMRMEVAWAIGIVSIIGATFLFGGFWDIRVAAMVAQRSFCGTDSFVLLAVPMFILAGRLMNVGGVTTRLFNFASCLVRPLKGGLGHANVLASMLFAGMSGSAVADVAGLGIVEMRAMLDEGYGREFSAGITGASALVGPIIPPSIAFVIYGVIAQQSIAVLFMAGVLPGIILAVGQMIYVSILAHKNNYPSGRIPHISELVRTLKKALLPLMAPVILLGGIYGGIFTPTEAASVVVIYSIILGMFVFREYNFKVLLKEIKIAMIQTSAIMIIVGYVSVFGIVMIRGGVPTALANGLMRLTDNPQILMLLFLLLWLVTGFFMSQSPALLILTPILLPIVQSYGIDPIHFGVVMTLSLTVGQLTPPIGIVLYTLVKVAEIPFERLVIVLLPYVFISILVIILLIFVPDLVLFLPKLLLNY